MASGRKFLEQQHAKATQREVSINALLRNLSGMPTEELERIHKQGYLIGKSADGTDMIICLTCMQISANPKDVAEKFCGCCNWFHLDPAAS